MPEFGDLTWNEVIERGHAALVESERLYDDINASEGRSNLDIEKHLRRSEVKAAQARAWLALARELGSQGDRYGHPGTSGPQASVRRLIDEGDRWASCCRPPVDRAWPLVDELSDGRWDRRMIGSRSF
jgi:hypothetical protein